MRRALHDTVINLRTGISLALLRTRHAEDLRSGADQAVALVLVATALPFFYDLAGAFPAPVFDVNAAGALALGMALSLLAAWAAAKGGEHGTAHAVVTVYAFYPLFFFGNRLLGGFGDGPTLWDPSGYVGAVFAWTLPAWYLLALYRATPLFAGDGWHKRARALLLLLAIWLVPTWWIDGETLWYSSPQDNSALRIDAEALLYAQPDTLSEALATLAPGRPGVVDTYFLGFAGWEPQDVFLKEVRYARDVFDAQFHSAGRSLLLANNIASVEELPLATDTNLRLALAHLGRIMDDEDILMLFVTSHGGPDEVAVEFYPLPLNPLTPAALRAHLDEAGIPWRVVLVSACYSGSFVDELAGARTLVATASAADRQSFGCSNGADFTYFGEALLKDAMSQERALIPALHRAMDAIAVREQREGLLPSQPQLVVGSDIAAKLSAIACMPAQRC